MPIFAKVKKSGARMIIVVPQQFAKSRDIRVGTVVDLENIGGRPRRRRYKLSQHRLRHQLMQFPIRIILYTAFRIKHHRRAVICRESRP